MLIPRRILGLDFSGARNAGRLIWLAEGQQVATRSGPVLEIAECRPAVDLPGGGAGRDQALAALRSHLAQAQGEQAAAIGCDFPFSLSLPLMKAPWRSWLRNFPLQHRDAEHWVAQCRTLGTERDAKRKTDLCAKTPFAATNLRLYRQTWHGVAELLAPLVADHRACVLPFHPPKPGRLWLLETCPASYLKRQAGLYREASPYKGSHAAARQNRVAILTHAQRHEGLRFTSEALRDKVLDNRGGDALDAVLAALITWRALQRPDLAKPEGKAQFQQEGYVYC